MCGIVRIIVEGYPRGLSAAVGFEICLELLNKKRKRYNDSLWGSVHKCQRRSKLFTLFLSHISKVETIVEQYMIRRMTYIHTNAGPTVPVSGGKRPLRAAPAFKVST